MTFEPWKTGRLRGQHLRQKETTDVNGTREKQRFYMMIGRLSGCRSAGQQRIARKK